MEKIVKIEGMKCDGCAKHVKENFEALANVQEVEVDLVAKEAKLMTSAEVLDSELKAALADTKYVLV